jgi:hypothetical protein
MYSAFLVITSLVLVVLFLYVYNRATLWQNEKILASIHMNTVSFSR